MDTNGVIRYTRTAQVEFLDVAYSLTRSDLRLIADALDIVNPDSARAEKQARYLANMFHTLAERPKA